MNEIVFSRVFLFTPTHLSLQQDWNDQVGFLFRWFLKIPGNCKVHYYFFPQFDEIFEKTYDSPYWSTVSVSQWMELFFTSVFVHPLLEPAAGLERDVQVAREELTQNTFWGPRAQIVLKLVASWPDKWCHIIMLVTYKSGLNGYYVSPRLCSMAQFSHSYGGQHNHEI